MQIISGRMEALLGFNKQQNSM